MPCSIILFFKYNFKMASREAKSGNGIRMIRSNRPGRKRAESNMSARLVAAITVMLVFAWKPSISVNSWFRVCSASSFPVIIPPRPRCLPIASISSINTMDGAALRASSNNLRTRMAPTPTNISINSEPEAEKNAEADSFAMALANRVLPVPGGPSNRIPRGIFTPIAS